MTALFAELAHVETQMEQEVQALSVCELTALDDRHTELWDEIVAYKPANKELAELMVLLLLDKIQVMAARGERCAIVREKLLEIFGLSFEEQAHYVRLVEARNHKTEAV